TSRPASEAPWCLLSPSACRLLSASEAQGRELQGERRQIVLPRPTAPQLPGRGVSRVETEAGRDRACEACLTNEPRDGRRVVLAFAVGIGEGIRCDPAGGVDHGARAGDFLPRLFGADPRQDGMADGVGADRQALT